MHTISTLGMLTGGCDTVFVVSRETDYNCHEAHLVFASRVAVDAFLKENCSLDYQVREFPVLLGWGPNSVPAEELTNNVEVHYSGQNGAA